VRIRRGRRTAAVIVAAAVGAVAAVAVAAVAAGATPATEPQVVRDHWYVLRLDGRPVGSLRVTRLRHAGDGSLGPRLETRRLTHLRMRRGDETVAMESVAAFVETEDGSPVSAQVAGGAAGGVAWRFVDEGIRERRVGAAGRGGARPKPSACCHRPPAGSHRLLAGLATGCQRPGDRAVPSGEHPARLRGGRRPTGLRG